MSEDNLDARLRAFFANTDTSASFEAQLMARIEALHAAPDAALLDMAERHRDATRRQLREDTWMNAVTATSVLAALIALVWHEGPAVTRWVELGLAAAAGPGTLAGVTFVATGVSVWIALRRFLPAM